LRPSTPCGASNVTASDTTRLAFALAFRYSGYAQYVSETTEQQSVIKVREALALLGARGQVRALDDSARTAKEAAAALGIEVGQIASSLIFLADGEPVLVIASGGHRVDTTQLAAVLGVNEITKANADDVRAATGFAIGGVAPVGHPHPLRTVVDIALSRYDEVWAAGGHPHYVFPTNYDELLRITAGEAAEVG
jgi:prolyl-tRNA editing enzyme YbaK/EbsC (Cys-tRNA(Pro) deacylase)